MHIVPHMLFVSWSVPLKDSRTIDDSSVLSFIFFVSCIVYVYINVKSAIKWSSLKKNFFKKLNNLSIVYYWEGWVSK